jgi:hypothetical protein
MKIHAPGAISGLTLGILSLMTWWIPVVGFILGLMSVWNAYRADRLLASQPEDFKDNGIPTSGMICGIIGGSVSLLWNMVIFGFLLMVAAAIGSTADQAGIPIGARDGVPLM